MKHKITITLSISALFGLGSANLGCQVDGELDGLDDENRQLAGDALVARANATKAATPRTPRSTTR